MSPELATANTVYFRAAKSPFSRHAARLFVEQVAKNGEIVVLGYRQRDLAAFAINI